MKSVAGRVGKEFTLRTNPKTVAAGNLIDVAVDILSDYLSTPGG